MQNIFGASKESIALHKNNGEQLTTNIDVTTDTINVHGVSGNLDTGTYLDILHQYFIFYRHTSERNSKTRSTCSPSECE